MSKCVHTTLCWVLAICLTWLPFSVSADSSSSQTENEPCHEINSDMAGRSAASDHVMHESMVMSLPVEKSMNLKGYCDRCDNDCAGCVGMASCAHNSNHAPTIIAFNNYFSQPLQFTQPLIESSVQYHSHIITPDFRPPIV